MRAWKNYILAQNLEEALNSLTSAPAPACPVAGGTDLLLELQQGHHAPVSTLVDLSRIPDLNCLEIRGSELFIGAAVPVSLVTESPLVCRHAQAVSEACGLIGGPQVRNTATLGGNVAHALPAADGMIALVALDAQAEVASYETGAVVLRRVPILSLFRGPGQTALLPAQILTGFFLPLAQPGQASAFARIMRPQGVALPILNMAAWLVRSGDRILDARVAAGPAGPVPQRAAAVEDALRGAAYAPDTLICAADAFHSSMRFRTSPRRATAAYRHHLSEVLLETVLSAAWQHAGESRKEDGTRIHAERRG